MVKIYLKIDFYNLFLVSFTEVYLMRNKIYLKYTVQSFNKCMQLGNSREAELLHQPKTFLRAHLLSVSPLTLELWATTDLFLSL